MAREAPTANRGRSTWSPRVVVRAVADGGAAARDARLFLVRRWAARPAGDGGRRHNAGAGVREGVD